MSKANVFKKLVMMVVIATIEAFGMTGCASGGYQNVEVQHVAVIMSNTKNEGRIDTSSFLADISKLALASGSTVSYFNVDGDPQYIDTLTIPEYKKGIKDEKKEELAEDYAEQIVTALTGLIPDDEELDTYKAIVLAARQLQEYEGSKTLYIASSGLSTAGLVDFTSLYLEQDHSDELVEALKNELPDLTGVKVVWFGLGETFGDQTDLYESNRTILENTWKKILVASGVDEGDITFSKALAINKDDIKSDLPYVSEVPISMPVADIAKEEFQFETEPEDKADKSDKIDKSEKKTVTNKNGSLINLSDKISFKPDSTELLTGRDDVVDSLSKIIKYLKKDSSRQILLVGTTSSWGQETSLREFSLKRCETIKTVLVEEGIKAGQIMCIGAGYQNNLTVNDRADDGSLVEEFAVKNRAVYLFTNAESPAAKKILKQFGE